MSDPTPKTVVTVSIAGEEYAIRADATPEYTHECAKYVDRTLQQIQEQTTLVEAHKAAILAALSLADELFQARAEADALREEIAHLADQLTERIENRLDDPGLASYP